MLLFRVIHCCCVALMMVPPLNCESAMNPPLANPGPLQKSKRKRLPFIWTRRMGEAWETAQNSALEVQVFTVTTLMVRFDNERQKFTSAVQLPVSSHWLETLIAPLMVTSDGERPRPATVV
jgi:hypothetical protein